MHWHSFAGATLWLPQKIHSARTHQSVPVQICDRHRNACTLHWHIFADATLWCHKRYTLHGHIYAGTTLWSSQLKHAFCTDTSQCAATILWSSQNVHAALTHLCSYNYVIITYWHVFADAILWSSQNMHSVLTHLCSYNPSDRHKTCTLYWHIFVATILWSPQKMHPVLTHLCSYNSVIVTKRTLCIDTSL